MIPRGKFMPGQFTAGQAQSWTAATGRQLRYWDQSGLVRPSVQRTGGQPGVPRLYSREDVVRIRAIVIAQQSGRSLQKIRVEGLEAELQYVRLYGVEAGLLESHLERIRRSLGRSVENRVHFAESA